MSRNDPRTQRGLAVARRMQEVERHRAAQFEKGMGELAWLGSRLSAADLQAINAADARGGLQAVWQLLAGAGLTEAGFAALEAQYGRGGLPAVGTAVQAQIQHEAQASAEQEAATALQGLRPEQWQAAAHVLATGGPEALYREAVALGMSQAAAARAVEFVATSGVDQARQAITDQVQARSRTDVAQAAAQRDFEAAQKDARWNPLAAQNIHQAALDYYATHAQALEAAGVGAKTGESPVAWVRRVANAGGDVAAKVAKVTGTPPELMTRLLSDTRAREAEAEMIGRVRASDAAARKARAIKPKYPEGDKAPASAERKAQRSIDEAARRAAEATGFGKDEDTRAPANDRYELAAAAADEYLSGAEPGSTFYPAGTHGKRAARDLHERTQRKLNPQPKPGIDGAIERARAHLESGGSPETARAAQRERSDDDAGLDAAMRAAEIHLSGGHTDAE
jgi:hypothetical protein